MFIVLVCVYGINSDCALNVHVNEVNCFVKCKCNCSFDYKNMINNEK